MKNTWKIQKIEKNVSWAFEKRAKEELQKSQYKSPNMQRTQVLEISLNSYK